MKIVSTRPKRTNADKFDHVNRGTGGIKSPAEPLRLYFAARVGEM